MAIRHPARVTSLLAFIAAIGYWNEPSAATVSRPAPQPVTHDPIALLASPPAALIRQRVKHIYRMPDGILWDGWNRQEFRRVVDRSLRAHDRVERGRPAPGANIVEDRIVGTIWRFRRNADTEAWGIFETLADERSGDLRWPYGQRQRPEDLPLIATADPRRWKDAPPLWSSAQAPDFSWSFALIDEQDPDPWTKAVPGSYLRITRDWGDGQYEFEGHSLDLGRVKGLISVPDHQRQVRRDRFRGTFFLWPAQTVSEPGGYARDAWLYIPADQLRITPEQLADALIEGAAEIIEWRHRPVAGRLIWQRTVRPAEMAPITTLSPERPKHVPPPAVGQHGPDLIILLNGRWFRGRVIDRDSERVRFATTIGDLETELVFEAAEIAELQSPERPHP
jgi:hypothetical protein